VQAAFLWGIVKERTTWTTLGVDGSVILKWIIKKWDGGAWSLDLAEDRDKWWALVNAVMNLWVQ
jgi:hypothetical protein